MHCEHIWTGRQPVVGWFAEDVGWSLEPGGCSFINQVETVNENTDISLPTLFKDRIVPFFFFFFLREKQQDVRERDVAKAFIISTQKSREEKHQ